MEQIADKRFPATPKRKREARKKGQVLKSQELISAAMLLAFIGILRFWLPTIFTKTGQLFSYFITNPIEWNVKSVSKVSVEVLWQMLLILGPLFVVAIVLAITVNFLQVGALITLHPLQPQLSRINPLQGLKRMFGLKGLVNLVKALFKVLIIGYFLYAIIKKNIDVFPALQSYTVGQSLYFLGNILFELAWKIALAFLVLAIADFLYQRWDYEKNLRMSHEEIKEEFKQTEGDPQVKAQIRKRQRLIAMRRMMEDLKQADVVITNPTHLAVALKYDQAKYPAPYVVAKGQGEVALRIKSIAQENNIVIMENKPLARALYSQVELGQVIPPELYKAVAEVLAFVYRLNKNKKRKNYTA
ncbi:MAG: flagellar biosynthesis protein FlhB [Peptococcaceae bacterium]|nr:flagellar biosynthesis protein FlhB [Peptococcaceae bacterium]